MRPGPVEAFEESFYFCLANNFIMFVSFLSTTVGRYASRRGFFLCCVFFYDFPSAVLSFRLVTYLVHSVFDACTHASRYI